MLYTYKNNSFEDDFAENEQSLIRKLQQQQQEIIAPLEMDNAIYSDEEVPTRRESRSSSYSYSPIIDPMLIKQIPITHEMLPDAATYPPSSDLLSSSALKNESRNKILQSIEILNIEERFLSIFITVFSIFAFFQISLLVSIKFDLLDTFDLTDNVLDSIFSYSYLAFLFIAKNISYASLIIFFLRIYSGAKFFQKFNSNLIISLLNQQFFKFLNIYMSLAVMIAFDCFLQVVFKNMEIVENESDSITTFYQIFKSYTWFLDIAVYGTIAVGVVFTLFWNLAGYFTRSTNSLQLDDKS